MRWSGVDSYLQLKRLDPALAQEVILYAETLCIRHDLAPAVSVEVKQGLCQFVLDILVKQATARILQPSDPPS